MEYGFGYIIIRPPYTTFYLLNKDYNPNIYQTPKYQNPEYSDPQKGTPRFWKTSRKSMAKKGLNFENNMNPTR